MRIFVKRKNYNPIGRLDETSIILKKICKNKKVLIFEDNATTYYTSYLNQLFFKPDVYIIMNINPDHLLLRHRSYEDIAFDFLVSEIPKYYIFYSSFSEQYKQ